MFRITGVSIIRELLSFLAKHCTGLPDDGSSVIRNILEHLKIFYNINFIYKIYIVR